MKHLLILLVFFSIIKCSSSPILDKNNDKLGPSQRGIAETSSTHHFSAMKIIQLPTNPPKWERLTDWRRNDRKARGLSVSNNTDIHIVPVNSGLLHSGKSQVPRVRYMDEIENSLQYKSWIVQTVLGFLYGIEKDKSEHSKKLNNHCKKCDMQILIDVQKNMENLNYKSIRDFICTMDTSCRINSEFAEWSNELLYRIIRKYPELYFKVLMTVKEEKRQYLLSEFQNPVIEWDYEKLYDEIKTLKTDHRLKTPYLDALKNLINARGRK